MTQAAEVYVHGPGGVLVRAGSGRALGGAAPSAPLSYAPPAGYESFTTVNVGTGGFTSTLDHDTDFRMVMPSAPVTSPVWIKGGRNVVLIGGEIKVDDIAYDANGGANESGQQGVYVIRHPTAGVHAGGRTVHLEGTLLHGYGLSDGVRTASNDGGPTDVTLQLQNLRVELGMWYRDFGEDGTGSPHGDVLQPFGGLHSLLVDGLTALVAGQGLMLKADFNGPNAGYMAFRRMNLRENTDPDTEYNDPGALWPRPVGRTPRYYWWTNGTEGGVRIDPGTVWFDHPTRTFAGDNIFWPEGGNVGADAIGTYLEHVHAVGPDGTGAGRVYEGPPPGGADYVAAASVGIGYANTVGYAS